MMRMVIFSMMIMLVNCSTQSGSSYPAPRNLAMPDKAKACLNCHSSEVKASYADAPVLVGRSYQDLLDSLEKVRNYRVSEPSLRHRLGQADVHEVATYFSSLKSEK